MRNYVRLLTLAALALGGLTLTGCDEAVQHALAQQGEKGMAGAKQEQTSEDCITCGKFRTRPPSGLNAPPRL